MSGGAYIQVSDPQNSVDNILAGIQFSAFNGDSIIAGTYDSTNNSSLLFGTETSGTVSEKMRIDSSGNLLVGTVSSTPAQQSSVTGVSLRTTGAIETAADSGNAARFNRLTSDGSIIQFRKDGTEVGSIGTIGGEIYIQSDDVGLQFDASGNDIVPYGGGFKDAVIDLGSSANRFKDLYLSGHVITGGGGSSSTGEIEFVADSTRARIVGGYQSGGGGYLKFHTDTTGGTDLERLRIDSSGNVGIGTTSPQRKLHVAAAGQLVVAKFESGSTLGALIDIENDATLASNAGAYAGLRFYNDSGFEMALTHITESSGSGYVQIGTSWATGGEKLVVHSSGNVGIGNTSPNAKLQVEEYGIDTTETSTTATTQVAIHTMSATTFRSARFTVQVTNSTDSTYHLTEILMIHDGTTPSITEYGTIFTGSAEATFDADISSGNVRLLATPASTDSMEFKVICHSITV
jgi:hypothetical protein